MEFVFGSAGSGFVVSCVISCRRLGVEMWMGFLPVFYNLRTSSYMALRSNADLSLLKGHTPLRSDF
jgi:hypothetical protein